MGRGLLWLHRFGEAYASPALDPGLDHCPGAAPWTCHSILAGVLGSWVSVFLLRRRLLSLLDVSFRAARFGEPQSVIRISPALASELTSFVLLRPFSVLDLRAAVMPKVFATDASREWQAAVAADAPAPVVQEFMRHALAKGAWTRLLNPAAAWLYEHNFLSEAEQLPDGHGFTVHPVYEAAARVQSYRLLWRKKYGSCVHTNIAELEADLREERRIAGRASSMRILFGLDSQVCPGALVTGSECEPCLKQDARRLFGPLLGGPFLSSCTSPPLSIRRTTLPGTLM